jgi:hypothetical protein
MNDVMSKAVRVADETYFGMAGRVDHFAIEKAVSDAINFYFKELSAQGIVLVPMTPTKEMRDQGQIALGTGNPTDCWGAMIDAAPPAKNLP